MTEIHIPYGAYWCSPFARWQGSLSSLHSVKFAAHLTREALTARGIPFDTLDYGVLGMTIPQLHTFYGVPWLTGLIGATDVGGPVINQACATSARVLAHATQELGTGSAKCVLTVTTDRTSNGPHIYYPNPRGPGGTGSHENWVLDNFSHDPFAGCDMTETAENCARKWKISTDEQHEVVLRRFAQYSEALADDAAFLKRFMPLPFAVPDARFRKMVKTLEGDEGVYPTTPEDLAQLKPVKKEGTVTFGGQTYPSDGAAGMIVTTAGPAKELAKDPGIAITLKAFGQARTDKGYMPAATIPAAQRALETAGIAVTDLAAIKSHNPFAVNDIVFARETGADLMAMNNFGCSLIWGHPQGPTGMRSIIELIEELVIGGGGWGLFQGCAAGDTAMAVVIKVDNG